MFALPRSKRDLEGGRTGITKARIEGLGLRGIQGNMRVNIEIYIMGYALAHSKSENVNSKS